MTYMKKAGLAFAALSCAVASAQASVVLDLQDITVNGGAVTLPYVFNYSIIATTTAPDTGKLVNAFDSFVTFSPAASNIEVVSVSSSLPGFSGTTNPPANNPVGSGIITTGSFAAAPPLPAGPFSILTFQLRLTSIPAVNTTYSTSIAGVLLTEAAASTPVISTTLNGGSITIEAVPEPLTAAGVIALAGRVLGRRSRWSV